MKDFTTSFRFYPMDIHEHQPLVFDQLSRLTRMENLELDYYARPFALSRQPTFQETVDLRLTMGLGKLSTLQELEKFSFDDTKQMMGKREIEWILEHWKYLRSLRGTLDFLSPVVNSALRKMLEEDGVAFNEDD